MTTTSTVILLGTGVLNWHTGERVTDRYGTVFLELTPGSVVHLPQPRKLTGERGRLFAIVVKTRPSYHIGDLFRGFQPSTPDLGERIVLGEGKVFFALDESIGLMPEVKRDSDWLDPQALYRLHHQTVELYFERIEKGETRAFMI